MAVYKLNGREVTEEEFKREVFSSPDPYYLDEMFVYNTFHGENRSDEEILKTLLKPHLKGSELRDECKTTTELSNSTPEKKEKIDQIKNYIFTSNKCNTFNEVLNVLHAESEEELEDILKRNMNIGVPDYAHNPATMNHTGGTVFEKVQDTDSNHLWILDTGKLKNNPDFPDPYLTQVSKDIYNNLENIWSGNSNKDKFTVDNFAKKETEGKLFYELDFEFIEQMAERMSSNKDNEKYEIWNWKKPMPSKGIENLKQAMWRHIIEVMQGNYADDGRIYGHLEAISNNAMMINYQLKNK